MGFRVWTSMLDVRGQDRGMTEIIIYTCVECGWEYPVAGEFDGRHGREDVPVEDTTPCPELAVPKDQQ